MQSFNDTNSPTPDRCLELLLIEESRNESLCCNDWSSKKKQDCWMPGLQQYSVASEELFFLGQHEIMVDLTLAGQVLTERKRSTLLEVKIY